MAKVKNPVLHLLFLSESLIFEDIGYEPARQDLFLATKTALGLTPKLAENVLRAYENVGEDCKAAYGSQLFVAWCEFIVFGYHVCMRKQGQFNH